MTRIIYASTYTSITPFNDMGDESRLDRVFKSLSVWDKAAFCYTFPMYLYDKDTQELRIPAGLNSKFISRNLLNNPERSSTPYEQYDMKVYPRQYPPRHQVLVDPRDNIQVRALEFLNGNHLPQRFLSLNTGEGKTFCAVYYCVRSGQVPAIFVSSLKLMEQWAEKIVEYTDIPREKILLVADGEIDKIDYDVPYEFLIFSHRTIGNYLQTEGSNLEKLLLRLNCTLKIFDEAHLDMENIFHIDAKVNLPSLYITATPMRTDRFQDNLYQKIYETVPKFRSSNLNIEQRNPKYHNVVICKFSSEPSQDFLIGFQKASRLRGFNVPTYSKYILEEKFEKYVDVIYKLLYQVILGQGKVQRKTVILLKSLDLLEAVRKEIEGYLREDNLGHLKVTRFHSKVKKDEKEHALEGDIIFSTDSSLSTAIDIPNLEVVLSLIPTSSETLTSQLLGRLRYIEGKSVYYFDVADVSFKECKNQLAARKQKVYKKRALTLKEINL